MSVIKQINAFFGVLYRHEESEYCKKEHAHCLKLALAGYIHFFIGLIHDKLINLDCSYDSPE